MHDKRVEVWEQNFKVSLRHLVIICHYCCHRPVIHCQRGMTLFVAVMKNDIELPFFKRNLRLKRTLAEWSSYCASGIKKKDSFSKVCFHSKICLIWLFIAKLLGKATKKLSLLSDSLQHWKVSCFCAARLGFSSFLFKWSTNQMHVNYQKVTQHIYKLPHQLL